MQVKNIIDEDFVNYKRPSMFIATCYCDWKCCKEANLPISTCQNCDIVSQPNINISADKIFRRYITNPITKAVCIGGLEPLLQSNDILLLIRLFRERGVNDDFVIYTGYYEYEIQTFINIIKHDFTNIIVKFGRYIPNQKPHYDEVLGIDLASGNQKGVKIC